MTQKICVVQLFYTFDVEEGGGGLSKFALELGRNIDRDNFDVVFASLGYYDSALGKKRITELQAEGYEAFEAADWNEAKPYKSYLAAQLFLNKWCSAKKGPVVIHSHSEYTDINAILLKAAHPRLPILRTVHYGFAYEWSTKPLRRHVFTNTLYPIMFNQEIGINLFNTERMNKRRLSQLLHKKARCIYNAIDLTPFQAIRVDTTKIKGSFGIPALAPLIGSVGRLAEQKGYCYLIEAMPEILKAIPQAYTMIIGDGPLADELKHQAQELGVQDRVVFTGARADVPELLSCMNLFVSSSLWEGLPTVLLEAMAANVPIVATNIAGTNELIQNDQNGKLAEPRNSHDLAQSIIKSLASPQDAERLKLAAKETVQHFQMYRIAQQYEAIYQSLTSKR